MKINRVAHIAIAAEQLEAVKAVFGGLFELPLLREARFASGTEMAMYEAGNLHVEVLHNPLPTSLPGSHVHDKGTGYFHVCLEGATGLGYRLEISTDLVNWETLDPNVVSEDAIHFVDPEASEIGARFYRVRPVNDVELFSEE